jgi:hypothetical protein
MTCDPVVRLTSITGAMPFPGSADFKAIALARKVIPLTIDLTPGTGARQCDADVHA